LRHAFDCKTVAEHCLFFADLRISERGRGRSISARSKRCGAADDPHDRKPGHLKETNMFIAMNRFRVAKGSEAAFEQVWLSRDSHLETVPGFVEFHLLKGPEAEDHTLYASHTVWESRAVFEAWTKSEAFRAAHSRAGDNKPLYLDHPQFEGFEVRQTVGRGATKK
jgi:heme-degrading monooxygenase HmoA